MNHRGRQPEVEVLAELLRGDERREVAVGGGDDADVDAPVTRAADAADRSVVERAQQTRLQIQRQLADLVEEQRAARARARTRPCARRGRP